MNAAAASTENVNKLDQAKEGPKSGAPSHFFSPQPSPAPTPHERTTDDSADAHLRRPPSEQAFSEMS
ncbi:hypothetical protein E4U58_002615 [Claviceps cyperi]|nr:hypothetical protein E4U58_002615 [Claviceps cyperi]